MEVLFVNGNLPLSDFEATGVELEQQRWCKRVSAETSCTEKLSYLRTVPEKAM